MSATFTETSWFHNLSLFVSAIFMICVHNFPHWEVSVKVGVMEFGLNCLLQAAALCSPNQQCTAVSALDQQH